MNREIKFKAKRKANGEGVYGYVIKSPYDTYYIYPILDKRHKNWLHCPLIEVIPETICQYTNLNDKNGVEIYENDKVYYNDFSFVNGFEVTGYVVFTHNCMFEIEYDDKYKGKDTRPLICGEHSIFTSKKIEVIGNKFDEEVK